jgi:hypothetical protein
MGGIAALFGGHNGSVTISFVYRFGVPVGVVCLFCVWERPLGGRASAAVACRARVLCFLVSLLLASRPEGWSEALSVFLVSSSLRGFASFAGFISFFFRF